MVSREKAIGNVLRDYSRAKDKGTRAATVERVLRMREENARGKLESLMFGWGAPSSVVDEILRLARGEA